MTRSECPVVAATGAHVDDFVFVGKEGNKVWETARQQFQDHSRWKMWEYDNFIQSGVRVEHQKDGGFLLLQNELVDDLQGNTDSKSPQEREGQSSFTTRTNRTERTVGCTGLELRTDRSATQCYNRAQFRTR